MTIQKRGLQLKSILGLLNNKQFIADSRDFLARYRAQAEKIGADRLKWERRAPAFMSKFLAPFIERWCGAYPIPDELLSSPLWQRTHAATMIARWGIIPVYPWTTEKHVKTRLRQIQRAIGKEHQDWGAYKVAHIARWLREFYISPRTGKTPSLTKIAAAVWGRKEGLSRSSKKQGIARLSERRETELLARYIKKGKTYQEAEQLVYKRARGSEAPASAMVRMALRRLPKMGDYRKNAIPGPKNTDKLGLALTMLLRVLPTSQSSPRNLEAICAKAVDLGNLLLPPESPRKKANRK